MTDITPIEILRGVIEIASNEMLIRGTYLTSDVVRPDLAETGALCGGRQACAVGSLFLAARVLREDIGFFADMDERVDFMSDRPALAQAYAALNEAAVQHVAENEIKDPYWDGRTDPGDSGGAAEAFFEGPSFEATLDPIDYDLDDDDFIAAGSAREAEINRRATEALIAVAHRAIANLEATA